MIASVIAFIAPENILNFKMSIHEPPVIVKSQNFSTGRQAKSHSKDPIRLYRTTSTMVM